MAVEIKMPKLGQTTDEVHLVRWHVREGDTVSKGQPLCEAENDKTTMDVESYAAGTVLRLAAEPDSVVVAGTVIAVLGEPGETLAPLPAAPKTAAPPSVTAAGVRATPLVQNIARKRGVDLGQVQGTGARGLITKQDVEAYIEGGTAPVPQAAAAPAALSERQLALGRNLQASKSRIPHYYLKTTLCCERLLSFRQANLLPDGGRVSIDALLASACARALARHPQVNAAFKEDRLQVNPGIHVGVAVSAETELYVPVVRDTDRKDVREIDRELRFLAAKARGGRLEAGEERGGTFTLTNLGMYPVEEFGAIINPPQVAILAFGRIAGRLEIDQDGAMRVRRACTVTGSFDHRAVNGAQGAAFLAELKKIVEEEL
ncbi:MAG: 2-oxo acid dehydrogenase subunit E2 [Spirochaetales bacterium]|nr:2-oxo acid dehydrogenase subunit E2 [Spirochaetales bacterium]